MRPWQHAQSSATGEGWRDDLSIHEFLDSTKASCADRRHRVVLHHTDLGTKLAARVFPGRSDISHIVERHIIEDMGQAFCFDDWVARIDPTRMPRPVSHRLETGWDGIAGMICAKLPPVSHPAVREVIELLRLPEEFSDAPQATILAVTMNACALRFIRRIFGPPQQLAGATRPVILDHGWIAEAVIFTVFGRIPDLCEIVAAIDFEPGESKYVRF